MTILVTGANGQLGNEMRIVTKDSKDHYIFTDVVEAESQETTILDITNLDAIRKVVSENDVKVIVNCAAWTNVDGAEAPEKYELVELLNAKAPENLAVAMKEVGGLLVHISTDYVFGGDPYNTPCKEDQKGTPTGSHLPYRMVVLRVWQKLRKDDAEPHCHQAPTQSRLRPSRDTDLCPRPRQRNRRRHRRLQSRSL